MKRVSERDDAIVGIPVVLEPIEVQVPPVAVPVEVRNVQVAVAIAPIIVQDTAYATAL